jgi:Tfp pilus assembly protein FimT
MRPWAQTGGFSLLELILVLALLTGVATLSIWAFFARAEVTLENAAKLLVEDLHMAQSRALFLHTPVAITFDADGRGYRVLDAGGSSGIGALDLVDRRYDANAVFEGVQVSRFAGLHERTIQFDAKGAVAADAWVTLEYRGESRTIEVDARAGVFFLTDALHD